MVSEFVHMKSDISVENYPLDMTEVEPAKQNAQWKFKVGPTQQMLPRRMAHLIKKHHIV